MAAALQNETNESITVVATTTFAALEERESDAAESVTEELPQQEPSGDEFYGT
jgi:hypothetical protein